jgi:helicase
MDLETARKHMPPEISESIAVRGIKKFTPPQEMALGLGLLDGKNILIASPTASGKTLIAEIACANAILRDRKKSIYVAPMRALVMEKFEEFKSAYPFLRTAVSIGDLDSSDAWLHDYDMLFVSTEKLDSLLRHGVSWLGSVGCIVFDEIHMLGDQSRGPTLEILITKLSAICNAQIIGLSATVGNAMEVSKWLDAKLVESEYRPVPLKKGVVHDGMAYYVDSASGGYGEEALEGSSKIQEIRVLEDTLSREKQLLVFYSTKRNAEAGAVKLAEHTTKALGKEEKEKLNTVADAVLNTLDRPTEQCIKLSRLIRSGIAFHHAGLLNKQRGLVENAFRNNLVKAICATTTLALGINLPAHTVLVRDASRYDSGANEMLGVNEVLQLFGRAGRPKYDKEGRAFLIAAYKERVRELYDAYLTAKPEPIDSSLGIAPVLRAHILAFIAENFLNEKKQLQKFMAKTFYGFQYGDLRHINNVIDESLRDLMKFGFVEEQHRDRFSATKMGKRVSELYIDPLSAWWMLNCMEEKGDTIENLYMIANTIEMRPYAKGTEEAEEMFAAYRHTHKPKKIFDEFDKMDYGYYDPVRAFSTALMLNDWMDENKEQDIVKKYRATPGEIYSKLSNADWMIYSAIELAKLSKKSVHDLINIRVRLRYGIKEELLDLVRLEQVGRVRARTMYINGIRTVADMRNNKDAVIRLFGKEIAGKILSQLG